MRSPQMHRRALALFIVLALACRAEPPAKTLEARAAAAIEAAAVWMAAFPEASLRFDAALMLTQARAALAAHPGPARGALDAPLAPALRKADRDADHPHRRLWVQEMPMTRDGVQSWTAPLAGQARVNPNKPISEALFCDRFPIRAQTLDYIRGPMRDEGGFHTTHAAFALALLKARGCVEEAVFEPLAASLIDELARAQPPTLSPQDTRALDLYGERVLMRMLLGDREVEAQIEALLDAQSADGSWGVSEEGERAYWRYHATGIAVWALSVWIGGVLEDGGGSDLGTPKVIQNR